MISERAGIPITTPTTGTAVSGTWGQYGYQADPWGGNNAAAASVAAAGAPAPSYNPYTGQADYSAAWIEYYRRQGMHEYADMIQRQAQQQGGASVQPQNGPIAPVPAAQMAQPAQQQTAIPQQQHVAPVAPASQAYGAMQGQPQQAQQQCDYGQWQQWQQWQAYQQAYQQQQPTMGHPMTGGAGIQQSAGMPQSIPMGGGLQHMQPQ